MRALAISAILVSVVLISGTLGYSINSLDVFASGQPKVTICHVDQETGEEKTITISNKAVSKHLANHIGDHSGECEEPSTPDSLECFCRDGTIQRACITSCDVFDCTELCGGPVQGFICQSDANTCLPR